MKICYVTKRFTRRGSAYAGECIMVLKSCIKTAKRLMALPFPFKSRGSFKLPKTERKIPAPSQASSSTLAEQRVSEKDEVIAPAPHEEGPDNALQSVELEGPAIPAAPLPTDNKDEKDEQDSTANEGVEVFLKNLDYVATLGIGGFGRVELVHCRKENKVLALKCLKKVQVIQNELEQHVYNEKNVMMECTECQFIIKLFQTYKDSKYIYFLIEPCLGGDLFTILQKHHFLDNTTAQFMTACVVEALDFLHERNIVYRDLKLENVMLDSRGYLKLVDFGFSKKILPTSKTWTITLSSDYVAPEIILGKGHDKAVDYWALGNFVYELLVGRPPFTGSDHVKTYKMILKGNEAIRFPKHVSKSAKGLIRGLCQSVSTERLGYQNKGFEEIRNHEWFRDFDWLALQKGSMKAPIQPELSGPTDTRYFDRCPKSLDVPPDELSGWDKDF